MKVFPPTLVYSYDCQSCGLPFASKEGELLIEPLIYPFCSQKCGFRVVYHFLERNAFDNKLLEFLQCLVEKKEKIIEFSKNKALFSISKYFIKMGLSNIKPTSTIRHRQETFDKGLVALDIRQENPLYVNRGVVECLSKSEPSLTKSDLSKSKGGLSRWF